MRTKKKVAGAAAMISPARTRRALPEIRQSPSAAPATAIAERGTRHGHRRCGEACDSQRDGGDLSKHHELLCFRLRLVPSQRFLPRLGSEGTGRARVLEPLQRG